MKFTLLLLLIAIQLSLILCDVRDPADFDYKIKDFNIYNYYQSQEWIMSDQAKERYEILRQIFNERNPSKMECVTPYPMPKKMHYFWTGPKMPANYAYYITKWRNLHPDWEVINWDLDKLHNELIQGNQTLVTLIKELRVKAMIGDIARLVILEREGGVFIESDVYPLQPIDPLACRYDYFTSISKEYELFRTPIVEIDMLGAKAFHPMISRTLKIIIDTFFDRFDYFDKTYIVDIARQDLKIPTFPIHTGIYHYYAMNISMYPFTEAFFQECYDSKTEDGKYLSHLPKTIMMPMAIFPFAHQAISGLGFSVHNAPKFKNIRHFRLYPFIDQDKYPSHPNIVEQLLSIHSRNPFLDANCETTPKIPAYVYLQNNDYPLQDTKQYHYKIMNIEKQIIGNFGSIGGYNQSVPDKEEWCNLLQNIRDHGGIFMNWDKLRMIRGFHLSEDFFDFDDLIHQFDAFFAMLPQEFQIGGILSLDVFGAKAGHPIIKKAYEETCELSMKDEFTYQDLQNALLDGITYALEGANYIALPSDYFFQPCNIQEANPFFFAFTCMFSPNDIELDPDLVTFRDYWYIEAPHQGSGIYSRYRDTILWHSFFIALGIFSIIFCRKFERRAEREKCYDVSIVKSKRQVRNFEPLDVETEVRPTNDL